MIYGGGSGSPPFEYLDEKGNPQGFNVELMHLLARESGREIEIRLGPLREYLESLEAGRVDLMSLGFTEARLTTHDFLAETWTLRQSVFFRPGRPSYPRYLTEMSGEVIAVQEGSVTHDLLRSLPEASRPLLRLTPNQVAAMQSFERGDATGVAGNSLVLQVALAEVGIVSPEEIPIKSSSYQLTTAKGRAAEFAWIPPALERIRQSGDYSRLVEKHLAVRQPRALGPALVRTITVAALVGALGYLGATLWNRSLRRQVELRTRTQNCLFKISEAAHSAHNLEELFHAIHGIVGELMPARNFQVVLYDPTLGRVSFPYASEVDPKSTRPRPLGRNLVDHVIRTGSSLWLSTGDLATLVKRGEVYPPLPAPVDWLSVPLRRGGETIGALVVASYVPNVRFKESDREALAFVSAQVAMAIDRTLAQQERTRLIADLGTKNEEMERFLYTASHDLKTPLVTIRSYVDALERSVRDADLDRFRSDVARIRRASQRMSLLLDGLVEMSRVARGPGPLEHVPLNALVGEAVLVLGSQIASGGADVSVAPEMGRVWGDRERLLQVFVNLIENAVKFMGAQTRPRIEVGAMRRNHERVFFVRDNGIGVDARFHHKVFDMFDKLDPTTEGAGAGLTLARRIVESHGGRLWVESDGADTGATFCFTLAEAPPENEA